jgi:polyisoprenoid-binding protein YceI
MTFVLSKQQNIMRPKFLILIGLLGMFNFSMAQTYTAKSTNISLQGNSTMHKWSSKVSKSTFSGNIDVADGEVTAIKSAVLKIDVKEIKSDKDSDMMDSRTHKSLNADKHPTITYAFSNAKSITKKGNDFVAVVDGKLTINGVAKNTTMTVTITPQANGDLRFKGTDKVLFTNHGLKAPSFVAGTLKVDNEVTVSFDVTAKK